MRWRPARACHAAAREGAEASERIDASAQSRQGNCDHERQYSLDFPGEGFENEPRFSRRRRPTFQEGKLDLSLTPDQETFRATVRAWLSQNIPRDWKPIGSSE